jgi:hypothetical protein
VPVPLFTHQTSVTDSIGLNPYLRCEATLRLRHAKIIGVCEKRNKRRNTMRGSNVQLI